LHHTWEEWVQNNAPPPNFTPRLPITGSPTLIPAQTHSPDSLDEAWRQWAQNPQTPPASPHRLPFRLDIEHATLEVDLQLRPFDIYSPAYHPSCIPAFEVRRHLYNYSPLRIRTGEESTHHRIEIINNEIPLPLRSLLSFYNISVDGPWFPWPLTESWQRNWDPHHLGMNERGQLYLQENGVDIWGDARVTTFETDFSGLISQAAGANRRVIDVENLIAWLMRQMDDPSSNSSSDENRITLANHDQPILSPLDLLRRGEIILNVDKLRNFSWPGIIDLGPDSRLLIRAHIEDDRRIGIHIHPHLVLDPVQYSSNVQVREGVLEDHEAVFTTPTRLNYTPGRATELFSSASSLPTIRICPGIHIYLRPGCPNIEVQINQAIQTRMELPFIGSVNVAGRLVAQSEWIKAPDGTFHMVAGRNRFEFQDLEIRDSSGNAVLSRLNLELNDVSPAFHLNPADALSHPFQVRLSTQLNPERRLDFEMSSEIPTENGTYELRQNNLILENFNNEGINAWFTTNGRRQALIRNGQVEFHYAMPTHERFQIELALRAAFGGYEGFNLSQPNIRTHFTFQRGAPGVYQILVSRLMAQVQDMHVFGRSMHNPIDIDYTANVDTSTSPPTDRRAEITIDNSEHTVRVDRLDLPFDLRIPLPPSVHLETAQGLEYGVGIYGALRASGATFNWQTGEERGRFGIFGLRSNERTGNRNRIGDIYLINAEGENVGEYVLRGAYWYCDRLATLQPSGNYFSNANCRANVYINIARFLGQGPRNFLAWMHHHNMPNIWSPGRIWPGFVEIQNHYYAMNAAEMIAIFGSAENVVDNAATYDWDHPQMLNAEGRARVNTPPEVFERLYPQVYHQLLPRGER